MKENKKYIRAYSLIAQRGEILKKEVFTNYESLFKNAKILLGLGYSLQINNFRIEVPECLNVWKQC